MPGRMSKAQRKAAFMALAEEKYEELETWYDAHPAASFEEIEAEARQKRRELMGAGLAILVNGRDSGYQLEGQVCAQCGAQMEYKGEQYARTIHGLEGDTRLERAYYVCPQCAGETIFPLDEKLQLRSDSWSGGAARVMTRCGLREPSFEQAAEGYREATGGQVSGASIRRVTQGFGEQVRERHSVEAERAAQVGAFEEFPHERWLALERPLTGIGNVSSDGTLILIREEGWKEVKVAAFSQVEALPPHHPDRRAAQRSGDLATREVVRLSQHSYCAGLWGADTFGSYQYLEGLRRGFDRLAAPSSVNDGAKWIARVTDTNFPKAQQIIDCSHGSEHLWAVGNAVFGEATSEAAQWVKQRQAELWKGQGESVVSTLQALNLDQEKYPDLVRQAPGYFAERLEQIRYADFRQAGYPIGSGTVESAARNVVQPRMRRPGRGWANAKADAMLAALAEFHSGRLHSTWQRVYATG